MVDEVDVEQKWEERDRGLKQELQDKNLEEKRKQARHFRDTVEAEKNRVQKEKDALIDPNDPSKGTLWDDVIREGRELTDKNFAGYNDWAIGMMSVVHLGMKITKAMWYDRPELTAFMPYKDEIGGVWTMATDKLYDVTLGKVENEVRRVFLDDQKLPKVGFTASLTPQGTMDLKVTIDGEPDPDPENSIKRYMLAGFVAWGEAQGYTFSKDPTTNLGTFKDATGATMDDAKFQALNAQDENSLVAFMTGRFQVPVVSNTMTP